MVIPYAAMYVPPISTMFAFAPVPTAVAVMLDVLPLTNSRDSN
jgi:hypothetical protein